MKSLKRLGVSPHLYCEPLIRALNRTRMFELTVDNTANNAIKLRDRKLHAAFLSPIDYAREASEYRIVPGVAVSSSLPNGAIVLHFATGTHSIKTLAVEPTSISEIILAKIILAEEFESTPQIVPMTGRVDDMLRRADAALVFGDQSLREAPAHRNTLDLVEAWNELANLPYVHGLWCGRERDLALEEVEALQRVRGGAASDLRQIALDAVSSRDVPDAAAEELTRYLEEFSYDFTNEVEYGLTEFLRYAYFHGAIPDVPDLGFYSSKGTDEELPMN